MHVCTHIHKCALVCRLIRMHPSAWPCACGHVAHVHAGVRTGKRARGWVDGCAHQCVATSVHTSACACACACSLAGVSPVAVCLHACVHARTHACACLRACTRPTAGSKRHHGGKFMSQACLPCVCAKMCKHGHGAGSGQDCSDNGRHAKFFFIHMMVLLQLGQARPSGLGSKIRVAVKFVDGLPDLPQLPCRRHAPKHLC